MVWPKQCWCQFHGSLGVWESGSLVFRIFFLESLSVWGKGGIGNNLGEKEWVDQNSIGANFIVVRWSGLQNIFQ